MVNLSASWLETLPAPPTNLFPLPLSPFEKYLVWDDSVVAPMTSFIELHFSSTLQVEKFEQAIALATRLHPLLVCTVEQFAGQACWVHHNNFRHRIVVESQQSPLLNGRVRHLDLTREPGIRFWFRQKAAGSCRILIQLHHATTDGVGLRRFLIDTMTIYALQTAFGDADEMQRLPWSKLDVNLLEKRFDFSESFGGPPSQPLTFLQRIKNAHYFHFQLPEHLPSANVASHEGDSVEQAEKDEPLEHLVFDRAVSSEILERARLNEVGLNELSLALLFETCNLWLQRTDKRRNDHRIRLLMPYDLRSRVDLRMPATNRLSFAFLGRRSSQCSDTKTLLRSVTSEIDSIKRSQLPMDFLGALTAASRHPRLIRWVMRRSRNMSTAVLTYAGDVSRGMQKYFPEQDGARIVGDARLDKILAAPPVRENTNFSLGLCVNWGQLCISAAWNREALSRRDCIELMELYKSRWYHWLEFQNE